MNRPVESYVEHVDELTQGVVNGWAQNVRAGNAPFITDEYNAVMNLAVEYRSAKQVADNRREHDILSAAEGRAELDSRLAFATAYKEFIEKREEKMMSRESKG